MGKHILIVEDDQDLLLMVSMIMRQGGCSFETASNRAELEKVLGAEGRHFDTAVVDMTLPDITGIEIVQTIRQSARTKNCHIALASGRDDIADLAKTTGADSHMKKPYNIDSVLKCCSG